MLYLKFQKNNIKYKTILLFVLFINLICLSSCRFFNQNNSGTGSEVFDPLQFIQDIPCDRDSDCALVNKDCCGCHNGGNSISIHISQENFYNDALENYCSQRQPGACRYWYRCRDFQALCHNSQCVVKSEQEYE